MNRTVSAESCPLCLKIWNLAREQLSVKYPFFRKLIWDFSFQESSDTYPLTRILPEQTDTSFILLRNF